MVGGVSYFAEKGIVSILGFAQRPIYRTRSGSTGVGGGANRALALKSAINPKDLRGFGERG